MIPFDEIYFDETFATGEFTCSNCGYTQMYDSIDRLCKSCIVEDAEKDGWIFKDDQLLCPSCNEENNNG